MNHYQREGIKRRIPRGPGWIAATRSNMGLMNNGDSVWIFFMPTSFGIDESRTYYVQHDSANQNAVAGVERDVIARGVFVSLSQSRCRADPRPTIRRSVTDIQ